MYQVAECIVFDGKVIQKSHENVKINSKSKQKRLQSVDKSAIIDNDILHRKGISNANISCLGHGLNNWGCREG